MIGMGLVKKAEESRTLRPWLPWEVVDPFVDSLWGLLPLPEFGLSRLKRWTQEDLARHLTGDRVLDNLILNKYEFATGATMLKSFPWRLSVPFILCNARCDFCSAWLVRSEQLPIEFIESLIPVLRNCLIIDLVGWGEPLIHPQLGAIIDLIQTHVDARARTALTTNGVKLLEWADRLLEANVRHYAISIHGATPETHNDVMGMGPHAFEKVLNGVRYLVSRKTSNRAVEIIMVFIVMQQNISEIPQFIRLCEDIGVDQIFFRTLKPQEEMQPGLDYHRLPPYLHPEFEFLR